METKSTYEENEDLYRCNHSTTLKTKISIYRFSPDHCPECCDGCVMPSLLIERERKRRRWSPLPYRSIRRERGRETMSISASRLVDWGKSEEEERQRGEMAKSRLGLEWGNEMLGGFFFFFFISSFRWFWAVGTLIDPLKNKWQSSPSVNRALRCRALVFLT